MKSTRRTWYCVGLAVVITRGLAAQTPHPMSIDATVGVGFGGGGSYVGRAGVEGAIVLVPRHRSTPIVAFTAGGFNSLPHNERCVFGVDWGRCWERYPTVTSVGVLGGLELPRARGALRVLVGPALFNGRRISALGGTGQVDLSQSWSRIAAVISLRGSLFPRTAEEVLRVFAVNIGWRIQLAPASI